MLKFISLFILLFISFNSHSYNRVFTPINNAKIVHGQGATVRNLIGAGNTLAGRSRVAAAVTTGGKFAVATLNPRSALGLGIQFAKANPYALAAMAASIYFQDEIGEWFASPEKTGENFDFKSPELKQVWSASCGASSHSVPVSGTGDMPLTQTVANNCGPQLAPLFEANAPSHLCYGDIVCTATFSEGSILFKRELNGVLLSRSSSPVVVFNKLEEESWQCPPAANPSYVIPFDLNGDGIPDKCFNPVTADKYLPTPVTLDDALPQYADDLMEWHNTSIDALKNWEPDPSAPHNPQLTPYVDTATGNIEPEYISSYNQPSVSSTTNEYMKLVSSGDYQTADATAPNYVPAEMVQPIQTAITSTFNNTPFIDPVTGAVSTPMTSTDGAATPLPTPTGTVNSPVNVTGDITVNVEIPEDDTISQTEYEQSNAKFFDQFNTQAQLEQTKIDTKLEDLKTQDSDFIDSLTPDITNFAVPDFPTLASIWPSFSTGKCIALIQPASVGGLKQNITFDAHCPPYNTYIHPLLVWLLYMATALYVFHLAHETLGRK